jgi:DNA primase
VIVVEGYVDVMACVKAGYPGAVAPMGTALTEEQIMVLWRMIPADRKVPILCFDGDIAGRRAAARACERILPLLKADHSARIAFLPDGQDPDSLVNGQGEKALSSIISSAMPLVDFLWMHHTAEKKFDTPEDRAGLNKTLDKDVLRIPDRDVQHYYRQAFKEKVGKAFGQNYGGGGSKGGYQSNYKKPWGKKLQELPVTAMKRPSFSRQKLVGQVLLTSILNHPVLFDHVEEDLGMISFQEPRLDALRQALIGCLCEGSDISAPDLQRQMSEFGFVSEIRGLLSESIYTHARFARPQSEIEDVQEGWQQALKALKSA